MTDSNKTDSTTKMAPKDINQDGLAKKDQQRTGQRSAIDDNFASRSCAQMKPRLSRSDQVKAVTPGNHARLHCGRQVTGHYADWHCVAVPHPARTGLRPPMPNLCGAHPTRCDHPVASPALRTTAGHSRLGHHHGWQQPG